MFKQVMIPALVLAAASAAALPAAAQSYGHQGPRPAPPHQGPAHQGNGGYNNGGYNNGGYNNWQSINARQASLDRRIDQGMRDGSLSRREATRVRSEFNSLARLEASYRRGGLTAWERSDLDRRFDRLSQSIRYERHDRDNRRH